MFNCGEVGHDGKTLNERCKGKRGRLPVLTFARRCCGTVGKPEERSASSRASGVTTGEYIVGTPMEIHKTQTLARKPGPERLPSENLQMIGGVP